MKENEQMHDQLHPVSWKKASGYANGIAARGRMIFVAGQIGWNDDQVFESDDFVAQIEQTLRNVVAVLEEGDAHARHIVRMTWYVTDKREYLARLKEVGAAYRSVIGAHFPAMTMIQVAGLIEDVAKVEIEATAVVPE